MSAVYAEEGDNENQGNGGNPNILTSDGILIESYLYKNRTLTLTLVDTNVTYQKGNDTFGEFYAALLTGIFMQKDSSTFTEVDWIEAPTGEKNLRFKVEFKMSVSMEMEQKQSFGCIISIPPMEKKILRISCNGRSVLLCSHPG